MAYRPPRTTKLKLLTSPDVLEAAMRRRDLSASELARLAGTHRQTISSLRTGKQNRVDANTATAIEKALRAERLFIDDVVSA